MADIVERLRAAARSGDAPLGVAFGLDAVADEIERLRAERDDWQREFHTANSELGLAADEIERLRAAGRALHAWITVNATFIQQERLSHDKVLNGWEEARRV